MSAAAKPYACPECGCTEEWRAWYKADESQLVDVIVGADGEPEVENYNGCTDSGESGPDEMLVCVRCDNMIELIVDPLDQIHAILSGHEWNGDTLPAVAAIIEASGRRIESPGMAL